MTAPLCTWHLAEGSPQTQANIRDQFPCFAHERWRGLHYLDNAATTQKPQAVIDIIVNSTVADTAPIHRGLYPLAEAASEKYEQARWQMARFVGVSNKKEIVFTASATASINLVADGWLRPRLRAGDEICVTRMEHHANLLPWLQLAARHSATLRVVEPGDDGRLDCESLRRVLGERTRLLAMAHVSNVLGVVNPVAEMAGMAHAVGASVLLDATQSAAHHRLDIASLGCDFLALSAHKMYGPAGAGLLWARKQLLDEMEPSVLGGGMVADATLEQPRWLEPPQRFEAGSPNLPGVLGMAAAAAWLDRFDRAALEAHERQLSQYLLDGLRSVPGLRLHGPCSVQDHAGIFSFQLGEIHPHDVAAACGDCGVCIRAGHHCCQPLHEWLGEPGSVRASLSIYNDEKDVDALIAALDMTYRHLR